MPEIKRDFDFSEWVSEGFEGVLGSRPKISSPVTEEFREHTRAAFREMLLAYRSLVDAMIDKTEKPAESSATRIKID